jgi:hypothetical protein
MTHADVVRMHHNHAVIGLETKLAQYRVHRVHRASISV